MFSKLKRRSAVVLALATAGALGVGTMAFGHDANVSSLPTWNVTPGALPGNGTGGGGAGATAPVTLDVQTHTNYAHPGDKSRGGFAKTVTLSFDDDIVLNLAGIPSCTATFPSSAETSTAWNTCGPGAGAAHNAYLSPATAVSGTASTAPPANFSGCVQVFKKSANSVLLFTSVNTVGAFSCANPATNTAGETSVTLTGTLSNLGAGGGDFNTKLTVPNVDQLPLALDDFKAKLKRANVFKARCMDTNKQLNLKGSFVYSTATVPGETQATDNVNAAPKVCS